MAAEDLRRYGVAVVPALSDEERLRWETSVWDAMDEFPEYKVRGRSVQRVLGGCGLLGNPSSFHDPTIRRLRATLKRSVVQPMMKSFAQSLFGSAGTVRLECLFDRLCVRCESFRRPTAELWHRDVYSGHKHGLRSLPESLPGGGADLLFGGWTNLDESDQTFVCLLGSHEDAATGTGGFALFDAQEATDLRFNERLNEQASSTFGDALTTNSNGEVIVPPGHCILFFQNIIHSVKSGPQPTLPALRLFHGYRLTCEEIPLIPHDEIMDRGGVPRLPSGQVPAMYSQNHYSFFTRPSGDHWRRWGAETFKDECLFLRFATNIGGRQVVCTYKTPGSKDNRNVSCNKTRSMPSLDEMDLMTPRFVYSSADRNIMMPELL